MSIGLREQKAFEIQRRLSRIRTLSRTIERADKPKKKRGSDLYAHVCVLNARIEYHARTLILPFSGREIFRPERKKGREDENRVIKNNAKREYANSRERANSLFTFDSCYKRTFLTVFVRTRPIFYACVVSVCLK